MGLGRALNRQRCRNDEDIVSICQEEVTNHPQGLGEQ